MTRLMRLQLIGPAALFAAVLAAEGAAYALALAPSSAWLWYANLQIFGVFQKGHYLLSNLAPFAHLQLFAVALPLLALALAGYVRRRQLALAAASNLSFVYAVFLLYVWWHGFNGLKTASLAALAVPFAPDVWLFAALFAAAAASCAVSHLLYIRGARAGA